MNLKATVCILGFAAFLQSCQKSPPPADTANDNSPPNVSAKAVPASPEAGEKLPNAVYWGDTHLHTGLSLDAGAFGNTLLPDEAWRFAKGEQVISSTGQPVRLARPLDWMVLTDHTDLMGFAPDLVGGAPTVLADPKGKYWYEETQKGGNAAAQATGLPP